MEAQGNKIIEIPTGDGKEDFHPGMTTKNGWNLKCPVLVFSNSIRKVCRRMQEVSRTETIGHRADFRKVIPNS